MLWGESASEYLGLHSILNYIFSFHIFSLEAELASLAASCHVCHLLDLSYLCHLLLFSGILWILTCRDSILEPEVAVILQHCPQIPADLFLIFNIQTFSGGAEVKASACNVRHLGSISGSGRCPGEGNGNPLQYSCLENPMDGGAWWATVHESQRVGHDWATSLSLSHTN